MSKVISRSLATAILAAAFAGSTDAQLPPPPPLPDEIRPTIVEIAPPPLRAETVVARPEPGVVWARGYWDWDGNSWAWIPGRWVAAPVARATWVSARYTRVSSGWEYVPAHWSSQRVVSVRRSSSAPALGHKKAKGKGHWKGKGKGHQKHD